MTDRWALVSVVMPARDAGATIGDQLAALAGQTYEHPWELLVIDNGSRDDTVDIAQRYADRLPLRIVDGSRAVGLNAVRNLGFDASKGDLIAYCDADDVASDGWLAGLADAALACDIVGGALDFRTLNDSAGGWRDQDDRSSLQVAHGFLSYAPGGNCAIRREVLERVRWSDDHPFAGNSEIEFCWRLHFEGYKIAFAPAAVMSVRLRESVRTTVKQWFRYGLSGPLLYRSFAKSGMPRASPLVALKTWMWLTIHVFELLRAEPKRGYWLRVLALRAGRLLGSVRYRVVFL